MEWETIERPGVFGLERDKVFAKYDSEYGTDNWRIAYQYGGGILDFLGACKIFEEAYFIDSETRKGLWINLMQSASEVYDIDLTDIESGLNYEIQNNSGTHLQDIAIRNVFVRRGWIFEGQEPIQIRGCAKTFGYLLSPYTVPFHEPSKIIEPKIKGKWKDNSVECWYQNAKVVQIL